MFGSENDFKNYLVNHITKVVYNRGGVQGPARERLVEDLSKNCRGSIILLDLALEKMEQSLTERKRISIRQPLYQF